ncbi:uroporphyrinogen-III synthase [Marimonas arenosa]|uniref:Uroporphyrinogen-III synthase n=1 Tax=Marimonas arenosa TaxID=1795305 RepID=A0AAE4B5H9_9RHOB|nr:uroporphyrinogen-III synthase [Marimonas arenosa]MDQ2090349.1 uroporphyrinogen-III synthase [Marimonas arenosa]
MPAILLTRPAPAAAQFAATLRARLGDVVIVVSPLLDIAWTPAPVVDGVPVFTSRHGVEGFLRAGGRAAGACWCVGEATASAAARSGFTPRSAQGDAAALVAAILASGDPGPFLHVRGAHTRGDVAARLRDAGRAVQEAVVYDQIAQDLNVEARQLLESENPVIVPLFSPRTAAQFADSHHGMAPLFVAAMSDAVRDALGVLPTVRVVVARRPDINAMTDAVEGLFDAALQLEGARDAK